ncbi:MAG: DUF4863 family protein [Planctomycetota bacterium]
MLDETAEARKQELLSLLGDVAPTIDGLDLAAADAASRLAAAHPSDSPGMRRIRTLCEAGAQGDWLVPREAADRVRFGRLSRDLKGYTVDCVLMEGTARGHTHPRGEVTIGFAWEGHDPRFDGQPEGWTVHPPGSHHVPTVTGGRMLLVYLLPGGEVIWDSDSG